MNEFLKRVTDYFDPDQLIDLMGIDTETIVEIFQDYIEQHREEIEDFIRHGK